MNVIEVVDTAELSGGGHLRLLRRGSEFSIEFDGDELMGSQAPQSEKDLAILTSRRMGTRQDRILIGGLGMGFTLGAALKAFPESTKIVVAELVPEVVAWANGPLAHLFGDTLSDPRVTLDMRDVHDVIVGGRDSFDAILLDVDNGPDGFIRVANDRLYCNWGLRAAFAALRPAGLLAIWSSYDDKAFVVRMENAGFLVEEISIAAIGPQKRTPYTMWFASKAPAREAPEVASAAHSASGTPRQ
jgi:spermidine synthase